MPWNPQHYAKLLLDSGDALAAYGDFRGAAKQYLLAAHFGQMMQPRGERSLEGLARLYSANMILQGPYHHLAALYEKQGDKDQAQFFYDLAARADQGMRDQPTLVRQWWNDGEEPASRNAQMLNISGLTMLFCGAMVALCVIVKIARSRSVLLSRLHTGRITRLWDAPASSASCSQALRFISVIGPTRKSFTLTFATATQATYGRYNYSLTILTI